MPQQDIIKFRRDTAANWTSTNPTLDAGEPGFETDTFKHKIGDGATAWADLPYAGSGGAGAIYAGMATLSSGEATVLADWVTADTVIVALPQAGALIPGSIIYADPADIVVATSFKIKSDDATDSRAVYWMATERNPAGLDSFPDLFYVSFRFRVDQSEIDTNNSGDLIGINSGGGSNGGEYLLYLYDQFSTGNYVFVNSTGLTASADYDISGTPIVAATWYVIDVKVDRAADHLSADITVRLDSVELGTINDTSGSPFNVLDFAVGAVHNFRTSSRDIDYFKIGSTGYGTDDIFSADFSATAPFDSLEGTGASVGSGMLSIVNSGSYGDAIKTL